MQKLSLHGFEEHGWMGSEAWIILLASFASSSYGGTFHEMETQHVPPEGPSFFRCNSTGGWRPFSPVPLRL
jgi:hypothetical protein